MSEIRVVSLPPGAVEARTEAALLLGERLTGDIVHHEVTDHFEAIGADYVHGLYVSDLGLAAAGCARLDKSRTFGDSLEILQLATASMAENQGYAARIINQYERIARLTGLSALSVVVTNRSRDYYIEKHGFTQLGSSRDFLGKQIG